MLVTQTETFSIFDRKTTEAKVGYDVSKSFYEFFVYKSTKDKNFMLEQLGSSHSEEDLLSLHKCLTQFIKARAKAEKNKPGEVAPEGEAANAISYPS